jgi:hypothetical protein
MIEMRVNTANQAGAEENERKKETKEKQLIDYCYQSHASHWMTVIFVPEHLSSRCPNPFTTKTIEINVLLPPKQYECF